MVLADAAETLRRRDASLGARVAALESEMEAQSERVVRMAETFSRRAGALEKAELTDEAKARDADDVAAELEGAGFEGDALLETKALLELDRKRASSENDAAVAALKRATKEKEQTLRRLRRAQLARARLDEEARARASAPPRRRSCSAAEWKTRARWGRSSPRCKRRWIRKRTRTWSRSRSAPPPPPPSRRV